MTDIARLPYRQLIVIKLHEVGLKAVELINKIHQIPVLTGKPGMVSYGNDS